MLVVDFQRIPLNRTFVPTCLPFLQGAYCVQHKYEEFALFSRVPSMNQK